ncbi:MAG: hypothetical protein AAGH65_02540 [Pseudomonadota bacterium]
MNPPNTSDLARITLCLIFSIGQFFAGAAGFILGWDENIASRANAAEVLISPATYAFSIWNVIYLGCFVFAVYQALPSQWSNPVFRRMGWAAVVAFAGNTAWALYVPPFDFDLGSLLIIACIPASLVIGFVTLPKGVQFPSMPRLVMMPLYCLAGWGMAASTVNVMMTLNHEHWWPTSLGQTSLAVLCLGIGVAVSAVFLWRTKAVDYLVAVTWALVAIVIANLDPGGSAFIATLAASAAAALFGITLVAPRKAL